MKKEFKLVKKVKVLLKKINCPRFLHHFGPEKYQFRTHAAALLLKEICKTSFRRVVLIFDLFDIKVPTYSALCKIRKRIPSWIWNSLLQITSEIENSAIIDGTGFSLTNPSFHYVKRIDSKNPVKRYAKVSAIFSPEKKKFICLKVRMKPRHDIIDAKPLIQKIKVKTLLGDSAYDAESLHEYCFDNDIQTIIKPKKNAKKGFYRRKQMKNYSVDLYRKRGLIESGFSALKRKYGSYVLARRWKSIQSEIYCKAICHNLRLSSAEIFN